MELFGQMGFVWVARVRTKGQRLQIKGQGFARTKIAVADSMCVRVTSVFGGTCVARWDVCCQYVLLLGYLP